MPRPKKGEPLSQTPRAIRERENRRQLKMSRSATQELELPEPAPVGSSLTSSEPIGVMETEYTTAEVDVYECGNCKATIDYGQEKCPICEQYLSYEEIK